MIAEQSMVVFVTCWDDRIVFIRVVAGAIPNSCRQRQF